MDKKSTRCESVKRKTVKEVLFLSLPIVLQNIFSTAVSSADVIMVGTVGQDALSAVSLAAQVLFVLNLILLGLTIGTGTMVSQYYGKGDSKTLEHIYGLALRIAFIISSGFALLAILVPVPLMRIFTDDPVLIPIGAEYLRIIGASFLLMGLSQVMETVMKATKHVRISSFVGTLALGLNVLFNAIFIFGWLGLPKMGVAGAALGTLLARLIEFLLCFAITFRKDQVSVRASCLLHTSPELKKDFWHYTLPITLNGLSWGSAFAMYSVIMGHLGSDIVAANSVAMVARNFAMVGCSGLAAGAAIYLGTELGGGELKRARKDAATILRVTFVLAAVGGMLIIAARPFMYRVAELSREAEGYLRFMLMINGAYVITKAYNSVFNNGILAAGGDTGFGLICDTVDMWCYSVPLGFLTAFVWNWPPMAVYCVISTDELVKLPVYYLRYRKGKWIKNITEKGGET